MNRSDPPRRERDRLLKKADPREVNFTPEVMDRTVIAIPLLREIVEEEEARAGKKRPGKARQYDVIIDLNLEYVGGRPEAKQRILELAEHAGEAKGIDQRKSEFSHQYVFARLTGAAIRKMVQEDTAAAKEKGPIHRAIFRIWPDFKVNALVDRSVSTVKADAARVAFSAFGEEIVWAVLDSGIDGAHPHFRKHANLRSDPPLRHRDFTAAPEEEEQPLVDGFGHGTHVAGIIAGELRPEYFAEWAREDTQRAGGDPAGEPAPAADALPPRKLRAVSRHRDESGEVEYVVQEPPCMAGMAPRCKLVSMKVLDAAGNGMTSSLIAALEQIQEINGFGRRLRIHGVNLSVGYDFEPEWFACGQSPLCVEVDRLVRSGVAVVVAAGNTGYGYEETAFRGSVAAGMPLSINDPGNAELAITVGSTHRDMPHVYGVSYFSSKGPTGDGRLKPDLVAPGEKIVSCAAGKRLEEVRASAGADCDYLEESGTSMAAPHVSGVVAAFLSVRREFIGTPEKVKEIFLSTATDLNRDRYFQGHGLVDLMRAIQSI